MIKDRNFELELPDGTIMQVGALSSSRIPDVKAFLLPRGAMAPFTMQNPPMPRRDSQKELSTGAKN